MLCSTKASYSQHSAWSLAIGTCSTGRAHASSVAPASLAVDRHRQALQRFSLSFFLDKWEDVHYKYDKNSAENLLESGAGTPAPLQYALSSRNYWNLLEFGVFSLLKGDWQWTGTQGVTSKKTAKNPPKSC